MKKYSFLNMAFCLFAIVIFLGAIGCSKKSTDTNGSTGYTVTLKLALPESATSMEGHSAQAAILANWGDTVAVKTGEALIANDTATVNVTGVASGTYAVLVSIDSAGDGFGDDLFQNGDRFWAGLNVVVSANKTITVGQYYWQTYESDAVIMAVKGVPAGKDGKVLGAGIFPDSIDVLAQVQLEPLIGGDGIIYNNSVVLALRGNNSEKSVAHTGTLPTGNYTLWTVVDCDGTPEQWHQENGNNPISDGDLIYHTAFEFQQNTPSDYWRTVTGTFEALSAYQLTVNFTLPDDAELAGHSAYITLLSELEDSIPVAVGQGTVSSGGNGTITADVFVPGTYVIAVSVDVDGHTYVPGEVPVHENDLLWGALNVSIDADKSITIAAEAWQHNDSNTVAYAIDGIPAGHDGEVIGGGLFPDGYQPVGHPLAEPVAGGWGIVYNSSCLIIMHTNSERRKALTRTSIPTGDYDVWLIVDVDGTPQDWNVNGYNPITSGDLITSYDLAYTSGENHGPMKHTGSFETLQLSTVSLNLQLPYQRVANGNTLAATLWRNVDDTVTVAEAYTEVSGQTATLSLAVAEPGTYQLMVGADVDASGMNSRNLLTQTDLFWGTLDLSIDGDISIAIGDTLWQTFDKVVVGIKGIPAGHDYQVIAAGVYAKGAAILNPNERPGYGGYGFVYNNSALLSVRSIDEGAKSTMPTGSYDLWFLLDTDGQLVQYLSGYHYPITIGDQYYHYNYEYTENPERTDAFSFVDGSFAPFVGIYGTVTCPTYTSGNIYLLTFDKNPLTDTTAKSQSTVLLTAPGVYGLPYFSNDSVYVAGFWDVDGSGDYNGPTTGDLLGAYGVANGGDITAMEKIQSGSLSTTDIDVELWSPFSSSRK